MSGGPNPGIVFDDISRMASAGVSAASTGRPSAMRGMSGIEVMNCRRRSLLAAEEDDVTSSGLDGRSLINGILVSCECTPIFILIFGLSLTDGRPNESHPSNPKNRANRHMMIALQ